MIVSIVLVFIGLVGMVWNDLQSNQGAVVDKAVSYLFITAAFVWFIVIALVEDPIRPLESLHDMFMKIPALRPYIDS